MTAFYFVKGRIESFGMNTMSLADKASLPSDDR